MHSFWDELSQISDKFGLFFAEFQQKIPKIGKKKLTKFAQKILA